MTPWLCWKRCAKPLLPCHCAVAILPCQKKQMPLIQLGVWNDKGYQPKLGICLNVLDQKPTWFLGASPHLLRDLSFFHHFHGVFSSQFSHFQSPYRSIATNFASPPGSTKALGEAARLVRKPSTGSTLKKPKIYTEFFGEFIYSWHKIHWDKKTNIWESTIKCPCSTGWFDKHLTKDLTKLTVIPIFNLPKPTTPTSPACIL